MSVRTLMERLIGAIELSFIDDGMGSTVADAT
jgi:hypothetical protein